MRATRDQRLRYYGRKYEGGNHVVPRARISFNLRVRAHILSDELKSGVHTRTHTRAQDTTACPIPVHNYTAEVLARVVVQGLGEATA